MQGIKNKIKSFRKLSRHSCLGVKFQTAGWGLFLLYKVIHFFSSGRASEIL